jgi:hypothetical protein
MLEPDGARDAAAMMASTVGRGTGSGRKPRRLRRVARASNTSMGARRFLVS